MFVAPDDTAIEFYDSKGRLASRSTASACCSGSTCAR
jgi:hypothetical protein